MARCYNKTILLSSDNVKTINEWNILIKNTVSEMKMLNGELLFPSADQITIIQNWIDVNENGHTSIKNCSVNEILEFIQKYGWSGNTLTRLTDTEDSLSLSLMRLKMTSPILVHLSSPGKLSIITTDGISTVHLFFCSVEYEDNMFTFHFGENKFVSFPDLIEFARQQIVEHELAKINKINLDVFRQAHRLTPRNELWFNRWINGNLDLIPIVEQFWTHPNFFPFIDINEGLVKLREFYAASSAGHKVPIFVRFSGTVPGALSVSSFKKFEDFVDNSNSIHKCSVINLNHILSARCIIQPEKAHPFVSGSTELESFTEMLKHVQRIVFPHTLIDQMTYAPG